MAHLVVALIAMSVLLACGGATPKPPAASEETTGGATTPGADGDAASENEFQLRESDPSARGRGVNPSTIEATHTEAAIRFIVVDKDKGPVAGVVISLTAPDGTKYYTEETDAEGFAEVLVPVGKKYDLVYLSLGRREITASVPVSDAPNQNIKLTMRYKRIDPPKEEAAPRFVLGGVHFDSGKARLRAESFARLDSVVEYMTHKKSARIEISGHTDNVGNPKRNKALSKKRAEACRDYLVDKGIEPDRIVAVGYGDEQPVASNDTESGRQENRRIEATEL